MEYTRLGGTGLEVSRLCLGCMSYGEPDRGIQKWTLDEAASAAYFFEALDAGINFFDTANVYSDGSSEEITGRILLGATRRDDVVIATKVNSRMRPGPNGAGLSRKAILAEIDHSLRRLGTDYVDLYQIHRFDAATPIEETLEALHDVVKAGKARYLGASSMHTWQFVQAQYLAELHGWTRFVSMQNHYNLLYREEEREMIPFCVDQQIGLIPWSPMARGRLSRDPAAPVTGRAQADPLGTSLYVGDTAGAQAEAEIVDAVGAVAAARGVSRAQVALAWVLQNPAITAPIIGATKPGHLADATAALQLRLDDDERAALEASYRPRPVSGIDPPQRP
ncbi:MAG: aldo/keto reductase [Actinomycetota bacterium]|nr:MAG: aldo/keto reductase [Actinomycetota bacterium]